LKHCCYPKESEKDFIIYKEIILTKSTKKNEDIDKIINEGKKYFKKTSFL
jgi:hypothetical protein